MSAMSKKVLTPEEIFQHQLQLESDLARFQRQYRILERDRAAYQDCSSSQLTKLKKVLNILKKEQKELLTDLSVAGSEANAKKDNRIVLNIEDLLCEHNQFEAKILEDKAYISELDMQISIVKKKVIDLNSKQVTDVQMQERILNGQKTLEALENKLENATRRFCTVQANNKKLREEINHLLIERADFNGMWDKLITNLAHGKKFMLDLIEQATIAYDQREEWCSKLRALRMRASNDYQSHSQEVCELERQIDHEHKLQEFLATKSQKRVMRDLIAKEQAKRARQREIVEVTLLEYKDIINEIQEFTGESDFSKITNRFVLQESENFALFQYANNLNKELEYYSDELGKLHIEIDFQRDLNNKRSLQQSVRLDHLREEYEQCLYDANEAEKIVTQSENELQKLLKGVSNLFAICKCSNSPFIQLLGENVTISNYNALLFLEVLEKRVNDLLKTLYFKEKVLEKKKLKDCAINDTKIQHILIPVDKYVPTNPCPLCIEQEHVNDVVDTLQFALNRRGIEKFLENRLKLSSGSHDVVHNVSACHLPASRDIIQRRYQ